MAKLLFVSAQEQDDASSEFNHENLESTVFNLYMAGTESTSTTIRFALSVLMKYPIIQGRGISGTIIETVKNK